MLQKVDITTTVSGTTRSKKGRYTAYNRIATEIPTIMDAINTSENGVAAFTIESVVETLGQAFKGKKTHSVFWGVKYVLMKHDIYCERSGDLLLVSKLTENSGIPASQISMVLDEVRAGTFVPPEGSVIKKIIQRYLGETAEEHNEGDEEHKEGDEEHNEGDEEHNEGDEEHN